MASHMVVEEITEKKFMDALRLPYKDLEVKKRKERKKPDEKKKNPVQEVKYEEKKKFQEKAAVSNKELLNSKENYSPVDTVELIRTLKRKSKLGSELFLAKNEHGAIDEFEEALTVAVSLKEQVSFG